MVPLVMGRPQRSHSGGSWRWTRSRHAGQNHDPIVPQATQWGGKIRSSKGSHSRLRTGSTTPAAAAFLATGTL
jgi:hypothetical protein